MSGKTVNVSFSKGLLKIMDAVAHEEARSRSELLREAVRLYVEQKRRWKKIFAYWQEEAAKANLKPEDIESMIADVRRLRRTA
jgi:metal-responsive CopG/Arc/MetJ family transcriptional regulator